MNRSVIRNAYAKVNLTLDVLGRREDGYHLVDMVMQAISLHDIVTIEVSDELLSCTPEEELQMIEAGNISEFISLEVNDFRRNLNNTSITEKNSGKSGDNSLNAIPCDMSNLMVKAAVLMMKTYRLSGRIHMKLDKYIPSEAGLAGGSTDAAAVIQGINELYELNLPMHTMMELGGTLGADIPFCILGHTARAEGIGEKLTALPSLAGTGLYFLLLKPEIGGSTPKIYAAYDAVEAELGEKLVHPDTDLAVEAIHDGCAENLYAAMGNVLEYAVCPTAPKLRNEEDAPDLIHALRKELMAFGARASMMSGSGSTVFGVFESEELMKEAEMVLRSEIGLYRIADIMEAVPV